MELSKLTNQIPETVTAQIPGSISLYNINTPLRLAHFLSQCAHESGNFKLTYEKLNYSAKSLTTTFGKYFPGTLSESYARRPQMIANRVYASRMGNGDEASGDGYTFRGRGYIQLTGKANYVEFDKVVVENILASPNLVATQYPLLSAAWFWNKNNLNAIADKGNSVDIVTAVTKRVNGGINGLPDRIKHFDEYYALLK